MTSYLRRPDGFFGRSMSPSPAPSDTGDNNTPSALRSRSPASTTSESHTPPASSTPIAGSSYTRSDRPRPQRQLSHESAGGGSEPASAAAARGLPRLDSSESIKCSSCSRWVDLIELGEHVCAPKSGHSQAPSASSSFASGLSSRGAGGEVGGGGRRFNGQALAVTVDAPFNSSYDAGQRSLRYPGEPVCLS